MAKSRKKVKAPKRIAGVKVPKHVRRGLKSLAASPSGRAVIAEALAAAGAAILAAQARPGSAARRVAAKQAPKAKAAFAGALSGASDSKRAISSAFEAALTTFTTTLRDRGSEGLTADTPTH